MMDADNVQKSGPLMEPTERDDGENQSLSTKEPVPEENIAKLDEIPSSMNGVISGENGDNSKQETLSYHGNGIGIGIREGQKETWFGAGSKDDDEKLSIVQSHVPTSQFDDVKKSEKCFIINDTKEPLIGRTFTDTINKTGDLHLHNKCDESGSISEIKSSSKILKCILESKVKSYTSDSASKTHSSILMEKDEPVDSKKSAEKIANDELASSKEVKEKYSDEMISNNSKECKDSRDCCDVRGENIGGKSETRTEHINNENTEQKETFAKSLPFASSELLASGDEKISNTDFSSKGEAECNLATADTRNDEQSNDEKSTDKPVKYRCSKCSCVTKDKRLFDNHSCDKELGTEEDKVKITIALNKEKNSFVCKECNFSSTGHGFEEHLMCHLMLRPYQCLYCKECFINRREISRHVIKSHNGAKMSCALRALRRAKGLIKEVTAAGTLSFMARVAGKVPLERDPEKKRSGVSQSKTQEGTSKSPAPSSQNDEDGTKEKDTVKDLSEENDPQQKSAAAVPFSKLREVLTADNPLQLVGDKETEGRNTPEAVATEEEEEEKEEEVKEKKGIEEQGLKIIASYSLNEKSETPPQETYMEESKEGNKSNKSLQPNFFMASPPCTPEPELVSFLGPERTTIKQSDVPSPLLPPPPLKPAPPLSDVSVSSQVDASRHAPTSAMKQDKISSFFICSFKCSFHSISKSEFQAHLMDIHPNEKSFLCYYCGYKSSRIEDVANHTSSHADSTDKKAPLFKCSLSDCLFGSNMITDFINHVTSTHKDGNKPACNACVSVFPEVSMLQAHLEENIIHIVNCPHCSCKASERRAILNHISSEHPGKPKMVSVAKHLICRDRKMNGFEQAQPLKEMLPPSLTPAPSLSSSSSQGTSVLDQILRRHDQRSVYPGTQGNSSVVDTFSGSSPAITSTSPRNSPSPASRGISPFSSRKRADSPESERSQTSETSGFSGVRVKEEIEEMNFDDSKEPEGATENNSSYVIDENGIRRRLYVPMSERHAENFCCRYCTFVARDLKRLACHERSHGMPPTRKDRFKCMFCPQGFDSEMKFRLHITCHPGLIKFLLYKCKKCEFDSNQKHTIVKHITCNRDRKHRGVGPVEDQYTIISRSLESRVLECEQCDYMTRHKVHMAIHYQREHGILRDKSDFTIEGLTPLDTPVTGAELNQFGALSPQSESSPQFCSTRPLPASKKGKDSSSSDGPSMSVEGIYQRNELFTRLVSQQAALRPGNVLENQARKFKCPICKYLLPKAADLKNHVKRHSEIGQITLVMFRCKYCSCMSTARELLYDHLQEKHPGKSIALVKKIVAIDTTETDKSFAETSVEESLQQLEESVHNEIMSAISNSQTHTTPSTSQSRSSSTSLEQLFVIPQGGDTFESTLKCPKCSHSSHHRDEIIKHVTEQHPEVKVICNDQDIDELAKSTSEGLHRSRPTHLSNQEEVLIVPDEPVFKERALCSRCEFSTLLRKDMVLHLQQNHPEISVMGRNSYPVQVSTIGSGLGENILEESCVVGSGSLDTKLRCLYENFGSQMKCLICGIARPKKFFIHVHILRHLNIYLWKCTFCSHRGLQKYKMVDHIKKIHPGQPMSVRYLRVNVESRVAQFMAQFNALQNHMSIPENAEVSEDFNDQVSNDSKMFGQKFTGGSTHVLGADELDTKINCLYDFSDGLFYKCLACNNQFQRKFAIHRHIIISHLKVALLSCSYCGMQGVEKHQMVDHTIACHQSQPVNFHTNDVDIVQAVADFLAKSSINDDNSEDSSQSDISKILKNFASASNSEDVLSRNKSNFLNLGPNFKFPVGTKLKGYDLGGKKKTTGNKSKTIVDPGVIMLGREALDKELSSLYQVRPGGQLRCLVCRWEFPRKYPLHRHIMLKHLRMNLVSCPYCSFNGVEKYTVSSHIKEEHKDQPVSIKYIQPDVKTRVHQFLNEMTSGSSKIKKRMSSSSPNLSMLVKMKREKITDFDNDEEEEEEDEDEKKGQSSPAGNQGLVVAMFGKKSKKMGSHDKDIVIKKEVEDDECEDSTKTDHTMLDQYNSDEDEEENEEDSKAEEDEDSKGYFRNKGKAGNKNLIKFRKMEAYAPGQYRSPTGGKPKALDVITKIKVLKSKEGPITKFYCEKCKFTSVHRSNIVRHIYKIHERYQTHTCPVCHYQTLSLMLMQTHMNREHPGVEYKEDAFTLHPPHTKPRSRSILNLGKYQRRKQKQKPKSSPVNLPLAVPSASAGSCSSTSQQGPKQYACAYCHYETNTQEDILEHTSEKHSQDFSSSNQNRGASKKSSVDKSKACWERSKKAVKRKLAEGSDSAMPRSKRKFVFEKGDELIQCGHCDVRETSVGRMQHHMELEHCGFPMNFKRIPAWRFVCKTCAVKTMATSKMKYHLNRHVHYRPYTCVNCGAFFPSPDQCRRHARANRHEEQYMYVRNAKKEVRVEELLQETRQLALKIQEEAFNDPDFDIANIDAFLSRYQNTKNNLKRTGSGTSSRAAKKAKVENKSVSRVRKQVGKSPQTVGIELNVTIKCYYCDFQDNTIQQVSIHHKQEHPDDLFLWTELDRGFTCDRTGEALPNCDTLPNSSTDVGYSTKISLGVGNNSTRFKCKSCDFSSAVIQAMKSHLKSHQPKGYVCPYCSRYFSGKEKLMRHQYCLHKTLPIWVIHLRKSSAAKAGSGVPSSSIQEHPHVAKELAEEDENSVELVSRTASQLRYLCNECSFTSDSLLQYRQHLSKAHAAFRQGVRESSAVVDDSEDENLNQSPQVEEANFQCGHCDYQASNMTEIEDHHREVHAGVEPQVLDRKFQQEETQLPGAVNKPLLNLEPRVKMLRIPSSTIAWYDDSRSAHSDDENFVEDDAVNLEDVENSMTDPLGCNSLTKYDTNDQMGTESERDEEEESFMEEGVSQRGAIEEEGEEEYDETKKDDPLYFSDEVEGQAEDEEEEHDEEEGEEEEDNEEKEMDEFKGSEVEYEEGVDTEGEINSILSNNSDEIAKQLELMNDGTSSHAKSEDMMIIKFDGMRHNQVHSDMLQDDLSVENDIKIAQTVGGSDNDEDDEVDDEEDDEFESNVTLASPLPMISLGDVVTMSPDIFSSQCEVNSDGNQDNSEHSNDSKTAIGF